ncbi:putative patatin/cPLA2 family phospholipase [Mesocricetibacter intestinalis]|uniref:Putative patatin/cPLA2 family phospholipase n=1 Tax=Mesocricetibacter intestinalis TaxID=1521930 RepID=A0A4R6V7N8_9PAST|nr:DUF6363 domain-containing protein [Mesocricetibacter intestinalis]TDQ57616.1 putative patatin/cPLA2 family phospholipase [Mesocricetibacter intestinalis]
MKVGLVLEGGAMRGMFTAGVLDVFLDENIPVDTIVSVSAGALFGVNLPSRQRGRVLRYNKKYLRDKRYMGLYSLITSGNIINRDFAFYQLPSSLDPFDQAAFARSGTDFWLTATNMRSGAAEYFKITDVFKQMELFRATSAMPFVSRPVNIAGQLYLDGGIADSIPLHKCLELGCDKIILVLTRPADYRKKPSNNLLFRTLYRNYPQLIQRWQNRYAEYNRITEEVIRLQQAGRIFVIRPTERLNISRLERNPENLQKMYELGNADGKNAIKALRTYLATK